MADFNQLCLTFYRVMIAAGNLNTFLVVINITCKLKKRRQVLGWSDWLNPGSCFGRKGAGCDKSMDF
jgi:hypothetical protein